MKRNDFINKQMADYQPGLGDSICMKWRQEYWVKRAVKGWLKDTGTTRVRRRWFWFWHGWDTAKINENKQYLINLINERIG